MAVEGQTSSIAGTGANGQGAPIAAVRRDSGQRGQFDPKVVIRCSGDLARSGRTCWWRINRGLVNAGVMLPLTGNSLRISQYPWISGHSLLGRSSGKIAGDQRTPDLRASRSEEETMSVVAVWTDLLKLCRASVSRKRIVKRRGDGRCEKFVILAIDPKHWRRCALPKPPRSIDQQVRAPNSR